MNHMKKSSMYAKFEKSSADREKKGVKEGSKKDKALDKMQMMKMPKKKMG